MNRDVLKVLGEKIKTIRESRSLTQANLAEELNMTASAFSKIELGKNNTPIKRLYQIADVLDVEITEFFDVRSFVAEPHEKAGFVTREEHESLKKLVETVLKEVRERLPAKNTTKAYTAKVKPVYKKK